MTIVTLFTHLPKTMFNVRIIEYPDSYHVRVYEQIVGLPVDDVPRYSDVYFDQHEDDVWYHDANFEFEELPDYYDENEKKRKQDESIRCSLSRSKTQLYYIARSNVWQYFLTLTINGDKLNRYDYQLCSQRLRKALNNLRVRKASGMYYLIVPEQHKDGAWHFHGLIGGCDGLSFTDSGLRDKSGRVIYNWNDYSLGFSTATVVSDSGSVANYITKYITKSLVEMTKGCQRYYVSKNVKKATITDYCLNAKDKEALVYSLYDRKTYAKKVEGFNTTSYFEIPKKEGE